MRLKMMFLATMLCLAPAAICFGDQTSDSSNDLQGVQKATAEFYTALNSLFTGDAAPMCQVWSHADDVTYMGPAGGFQVGWEQIRSLWESQAELKLGGQVLPENVHTTVGRDLAIVNCLEVGSNVDAEGQVVQVSIRVTNIFRKENGEWKMIGHHTDLLPFLEKQQLSSLTN